MLIKEVTYQLSRTINTGNYESAKVDISMTACVDEDEKIGEVYERIRDLVKLRVLEEVRDILETNIRQRAKEDF